MFVGAEEMSLPRHSSVLFKNCPTPPFPASVLVLLGAGGIPLLHGPLSDEPLGQKRGWGWGLEGQEEGAVVISRSGTLPG